MRLVIIESPYAANPDSKIPKFIQRWLNKRYARKCVYDSLQRGEAPIASHLLYTQPGIFNDNSPLERCWGIEAGLAWIHKADASVVYTDRGISKGMRYGMTVAKANGLKIEERQIE